jgi:hypothetical protein
MSDAKPTVTTPKPVVCSECDKHSESNRNLIFAVFKKLVLCESCLDFARDIIGYERLARHGKI